MTEQTKGKKTLLLVDDDLVTSTLLRKKCEDEGYTVDYFANGRAALENLDINRHSLVLLDIMMPEISGIEVLKQIRERFSSAKLPVIMITSLGETKDISKAFACGASDYIVKPVNIAAALARIATHLQLQKIHEDSMKDQHFETIKAMIVTYNHEINNPLAIALGHLSLMRRKQDLSYIDKVETALNRIADIVRKIETFKYESAKEVEYVKDSKMFKVD